MSKHLFNKFPHITKEMWNTLTTKEQKYFRIMNSGAGILNVIGEPGHAKSAILNTIADKLEFQIIVHYLSTIDETDVGIYPIKGVVNINGVDHNCMEYVPPKWAFLANTKPTIVVFEELPLASDAVRRAVLGIFNEKVISHILKFNPQVLMASTGNLGIEDGTDGVEDMSSAVINRINTVHHTLSIKDWIDGYAAENVHPEIVKFLMNEPKWFAGKPSKKDPWCSPRTWTYVSHYIRENFEDEPLEKIIDVVCDEAIGWVGSLAMMEFTKYVTDKNKISLKDFIDLKPDKVKGVLEKLSKPRLADLMYDLSISAVHKFTDPQLSNVIKLLHHCHIDERAGYFKTFFKNDKLTAYSKTPEYKNYIDRVVKEFKDEIVILTTKNV